MKDATRRLEQHLTKQIYFHRTNSDARQPTKAHEGDAGWDLYVSRPAVVQPGQLVEIHTDIRVALPPGYWAHLLGRSSTPRRHGLQVIEAVIDNGYRGEMFIAVRSFRHDEMTVTPGLRLAQLIPHKIADLTWSEADSLGDTKRGAGGFGSSGS